MAGVNVAERNDEQSLDGLRVGKLLAVFSMRT